MTNRQRLRFVQSEVKKIKKRSKNISHAKALKEAWFIYHQENDKKKPKLTVKHKRKKVRGVSTRSRSHVDRNKITAHIHSAKNVQLGSVKKNIFYKGFLIEGRLFELGEEKFKNGRVRKYKQHTFWRLCDPKNGMSQSGWFYQLSAAKSYARHLAK